MSTDNPQRDIDELLQICASKFDDAGGERLLNDFVMFAQQCDDPVRALGRADVVMRILRSRTRGKELNRPPSVRGRARLNSGPGLINQED
jgi:hypothetical protein